MSDRAYQNAIKRRDELRRELQEVEEFLRLWTRFGGEDTKPSNLTVIRRRPIVISPEEAEAAGPPPRGLSRRKIAKHARTIMVERGHPLTRGDLVKEFRRRGLPLGGTEPERNMGTVMWRLKDQFVNLEGRGYWPRDIPTKGYDPSDANSPEAIAHTLDLEPTK